MRACPLPVQAANERASLTAAAHIAGQSPVYHVTRQTSSSLTASVQLPAGCPVSSLTQGPGRPTAEEAKAAAAWTCLEKLQGQGLLAGYWSSAALLQQAGVEVDEGGGSEAVVWRCEVCGVPATSARNLQVCGLHQIYCHHHYVYCCCCTIYFYVYFILFLFCLIEF